MRKGNKVVSVILGVLLIIFGIYLFNRPITTLLSVTMLLAAGVLFRAITGIILFFTRRSDTGHNDWWLLISSILFGIFGLILAFNPALTATVVLYMVGFWFIIEGISGIYLSSHIRRSTGWKWAGIIIGVILLIFGISLVFNPLRSLIALNVLVGLALLFNGIQILFGTLMYE